MNNMDVLKDVNLPCFWAVLDPHSYVESGLEGVNSSPAARFGCVSRSMTSSCLLEPPRPCIM